MSAALAEAPLEAHAQPHPPARPHGHPHAHRRLPAAGPRPGPPSLRLLPVPDCEPAPLPGPPQLPPDPGRDAGLQLRLVVGGVAAAPGTAAPPAGGLPDPGPFATTLAQAVVDVLAGHRPAQQLLRWARPDVLDMLRRRTAAAGADLPGPRRGSSRRPVVRSVRTCRVAAGAVEASAVVVDGDRARAMAFRLEAGQGRWRVAVLELG